MKASLLRPGDSVSMDSVVQLVMDCSPMPHVDREETARELAAFIGEERNLFVIVKNNEERVIGFCGVTPHDWVLEDLLPHDPHLRQDPDRYYLEMMGVAQEYRKSAAFIHLTFMSVESSLAMGVHRFSSHSLISNGINATVKKLFSQCVGHRVISDWMGTGESCEYLEFSVSDKDIVRMRKILRLK